MLIKRIYILVCVYLLMWAVAPAVYSNCVGVYTANSYAIIDIHTIILYDFSNPIAILKTPWCSIFNYSDICLGRDYICEGDELIIDGKKCEIREIRFLTLEDIGILTIEKEKTFLSLNDFPRFSPNEFSNNLTIEALCEDINNDDYGIKFKTLDNTIDRLNEILEIPNFYDICSKKRNPLRLSKYAEKLIDESKDFRHKSFSELSEGQKNTILKLNRMILETIYPNTCPKILLKSCPNN